MYKIQLLTNETDEALIGIYIDRAVVTIRNYINDDRLPKDFIISNYEDAVVAIVENMYKTKDSKYIKSMSQGKRSESYDESINIGVTDEIKKMLPTPKMRMM